MFEIYDHLLGDWVFLEGAKLAEAKYFEFDTESDEVIEVASLISPLADGVPAFLYLVVRWRGEVLAFRLRGRADSAEELFGGVADIEVAENTPLREVLTSHFRVREVDNPRARWALCLRARQ